MSTQPATVAQFLASLPADRRAAIEALREVVNANIDPAFEEGIQYRMLAWYLPHSRYPAGYHCDPKQPLPFASIASTKGGISLHLFCIYGNDGEVEQFQSEWRASGKKLDMGKACVRVKTLADVPLDVLGRAIKRLTAKKFVAHYEASIPAAGKAAAKAAKTSPKPGAKSAAAPAAKKTAKLAAKPAAKKVAKKAAKKAAARATKRTSK
jgi:hypothetical protein